MIPRQLVPIIVTTIVLTSSVTFYLTRAYAQTQPEMNHEAYTEFEKQDKLLNKEYKILLKKCALKETHDKLVASQRAWIKFRDAEAHFVASYNGEGGSIYPMYYNYELANRTSIRIEEMKKIQKDAEVDGR